MNKWISVKKQLPPIKSDGFERYIIASWDIEKQIYVVEQAAWHDDHFQDSEGDIVPIEGAYWRITHWMTLPSPPDDKEKKLAEKHYTFTD